MMIPGMGMMIPGMGMMIPGMLMIVPGMALGSLVANNGLSFVLLLQERKWASRRVIRGKLDKKGKLEACSRN